MNCNFCNHSNAEDALYCELCGNQLLGKKSCQSCGFTNIYNAYYCKHCGEPFSRNPLCRDDILMPFLSDSDGVKGTPLFGYKKISDGTVWIPPMFSFATEFSDGYAIVRPDNSSCWGLIDKEGKMVISPIYSSLLFPSEGLTAARLNGKWGFVNLDGQMVIPFIFDEVHRFSSGLAVVGLDYSYYFESLKDDERYDLFGLSVGEYFDNGLSKNRVLYGFINHIGKIVIDAKYQKVTDFGGQYAFVSRGYSENFIIDHVGKVALDLNEYCDNPYHLECQITPKGTIWVKAYYPSDIGEEMGNIVLDSRLNPIFPMGMYPTIGRFKDGYAVVCSSNKNGIINEIGQFVLETEDSENVSFDEERFGDGVFNVSRTLPLTEQQTAYIESGHYRCVELTVQNSWMNLQGRLIQPWGDNHLLRVYSNYRVAHEKNGKWGFLDKDGEVAVPYIYDSCEDYKNGIAVALKDGKTYLLDLFGNKREIINSSSFRNSSFPMLK